MQRLSRSARETARTPSVVADRHKGRGRLDQGRGHLEAAHPGHTTPTAERGTAALREAGAGAEAGARAARTWPRTPGTSGMKAGPRCSPGKHGKSLAVVCPPRCPLPPRTRSSHAAVASGRQRVAYRAPCPIPRSFGPRRAGGHACNRRRRGRCHAARPPPRRQAPSAAGIRAGGAGADARSRAGAERGCPLAAAFASAVAAGLCIALHAEGHGRHRWGCERTGPGAKLNACGPSPEALRAASPRPGGRVHGPAVCMSGWWRASR